MKKAFSGFTAGLVLAFAVVGVVSTVSAATGETAHRDAGTVSTQPRSYQPSMPRACFSLRCINRSLHALNRAVFRCERLLNVGQFFDYQSTTPGVPTSALDFSTPGAGVYKVVYDRCG
jgi:hypothetical protein